MNVKLLANMFASIILALLLSNQVNAKEVMTPEKLWQVKRVSPLGLNKAGTHVLYKVTIPNIENNDFDSKVYQVSIKDGSNQLIENYQGLLADKNTSPDGNKKLFHVRVREKNLGNFGKPDNADDKQTDRHKDCKKAVS